MAIRFELGPQLESFISSLVASGRFPSPEAVMREALRLFQEREARFSELDAAIQRGLADADAGRLTPASEVFDELEAKYAALATAADA
jgi:antitoxin ParD1/3/4